MSTTTGDSSPRARWWTVTVFAIAMAWVESAVVFYLRTMLHRIDPYQSAPLPVVGNLEPAELVREIATLIMLLTVGMLAGRTWRMRLGYSAIAFGFWDIFYYVFLRVICGWPRSLFDWDVLFLLPLPWWGPISAPISIAALMIIWGTLVNRGEAQTTAQPGEKPTWLLGLLGIILALYVFMTDSLLAVKGGEEAVRHALPVAFNWRLFGLAFLLMAAPVANTFWHSWQQNRLEPKPEFARIEPMG